MKGVLVLNFGRLVGFAIPPYQPTETFPNGTAHSIEEIGSSGKHSEQPTISIRATSSQALPHLLDPSHTIVYCYSFERFA
jgi:hypothetical protein